MWLKIWYTKPHRTIWKMGLAKSGAVEVILTKAVLFCEWRAGWVVLEVKDSVAKILVRNSVEFKMRYKHIECFSV